jgi:hypothetical protein
MITKNHCSAALSPNQHESLLESLYTTINTILCLEAIIQNNWPSQESFYQKDKSLRNSPATITSVHGKCSLPVARPCPSSPAIPPSCSTTYSHFTASGSSLYFLFHNLLPILCPTRFFDLSLSF